MSYNKTYQNNPNLWGNKPNNLLLMFENDFIPNSNVLDLGCGQGRDALYLAKKGFNVLAIDSSNIAIKQLLEKSEQEQLTNLTVECVDASNFSLQSNKYQIINLHNLLQFIGKDNSLKLINNIKDKLSPDGFVIIKAFTTNDPESLKNNPKTHTFFEPNELKKLFDGFKIKHYIEHTIKDIGHTNKPEPHYHGIVELVAQKTTYFSINDYLKFLNQTVNVKIERPLGSFHPKHNFKYPVNYGFVPNTKAPDNEEIDAYILGVDKPLEEFTGICVAIIHRTNDNDNKLIVVPNNQVDISDQEIKDNTHFQEQYFESVIIREKLNV